MKKGKEIKCCDTQRRIPCPQLCLHIWAVPQLSRDSFCLHLYRLIVFFSFFFPIRYTSVGNRSNTQPNAALRVVDPLTGSETYRPAYLLHDCLTERQGRLWRAVPSSLYLGPPRDHPSVYTKTCPDPPAVRLIPSSSIIRIPSSP